jgi:hypothetical protein
VCRGEYSGAREGMRVKNRAPGHRKGDGRVQKEGGDGG